MLLREHMKSSAHQGNEAGTMKKMSRIFIISILLALMNAQIVTAVPTVYPKGTTIYESGKTYDGYTLFATREGTALAFVALIDMGGNTVHTWQRPDYGLNYAEPLPNGNLLAFYGGVGIVELDLDSNEVWKYEYDVPDGELHHDFVRMENGNTLLLANKTRSVPEISPKPILDDSILEINQAGEVLWEWHTYEHYEAFGFSPLSKRLISIKGGDWAHTNSISILPDNSLGDIRFRKGNILVSQRETNIIFVIDKETGEIVWKIDNEDYMTIGQHDAKMIPQDLPGAGHILVFDNGSAGGYPLRARGFSRVLEIDPLSKSIVWEYNASMSGLYHTTFYSAFISGAQRLPNGNTLILEGASGRFFEVTQEGEIVWEYINPFFDRLIDLGREVERNFAYRAWRVPLDWLPQN